MKTSMIALLFVGYFVILVAVLAYLLRRSYRSEEGYVARWLHKRYTKNSPQRARMLKRAAGLKVKQPEKPPPYTYEVVKAQLPFSDENHFFTEISRSHLHHQQAPFFWTPPPIQERRNLPKLFVECFPEGERNFRRSASDELKENSGSEFKKEEVYQTYSDIENNELTCFHDTLSRSDSCMSLIDENSESTSPRSTPSSSRSSSEKRRSPFEKKHHSPRFEKRPIRHKGDGSSIKDKLKKKLSRTKSNEDF